MKKSFSKSELVQLLGATSIDEFEDRVVSGVSFNSANIKEGELFIALQGQKSHGHQFLDDAFKRGASLALVEDYDLLKSCDYSPYLLCVPNTLSAFWQLARVVRDSFKGRVTAVVGSVGKTTTKEILAFLLKRFSTCTASVASFNNHIGAPYTICNANLDDEHLVLELGMNHPRELEELSLLAKPHCAVMTMIAPEHMEFFSSLQDVADAEFEILAGLSSDGTLILFGEDGVANERLNVNLKRWDKTQLSVRTFGFLKNDLLQITDFKHTFESVIKGQISSCFFEENATACINLIGRHNAGNIAAALLTALTVMPSLNFSELVLSLSEMQPPQKRLKQIRVNDCAPLIIDDSYNASPEAIVASLGILDEARVVYKRIGLILGDMLELGSFSKTYHEELLQPIVSVEPAVVICVGNYMSGIVQGLKSRGVRASIAESAEHAAQIMAEDYAHGNRLDVILVKGSRGMGLDVAVNEIVKFYQNQH